MLSGVFLTNSVEKHDNIQNIGKLDPGRVHHKDRWTITASDEL